MAADGWKQVRSAQWARLAVLLVCAIGAQAMQHLHAAEFRFSAAAAGQVSGTLAAASAIKIVAIVVLSFHFARILIQRRSGWHAPDRGRRADRYLGFILAVNLTIAAALLLCISLVNSGGFAALEAAGMSRRAAKAVLIGAVLLLTIPLNKRVFTDVALAIGSSAADRLRPHEVPPVNKLFLSQLLKNAAIFLLPAFAIHVLLATAPAGSAAAYAALASLDCLVVAALALAAGYTIFISHEAALGSRSAASDDSLALKFAASDAAE